MPETEIRSEKLIRMTRRLSMKWYYKMAITLFAIVIAFFACSFMIFTVSTDYGSFFTFFHKGTFLNFGRVLTHLKNSALLFLIAVALTPVFKMKFWNIGAEGQCLTGALGAVIVMYFWAPHLPIAIAIILELLFAVVFAVVWAVIPAIFKAFFNTNETLFTLMMNYVATGIVVAFAFANSTDGNGNIEPLWTKAEEHFGWLPVIDAFKNSYLIIIIIALVVAGIIMVYLKYSKHGYELSVVGGSQNTARYVGINVKKVIIRTVILTGAICGIVGFLIVSGSEHKIASDSIAGMGFSAIIICWIGNFSVPLMLFYACLITFISAGCANALDWAAGGKPIAGMDSITVGLFFMIVIISTFFINFKLYGVIPDKISWFFKKVSFPFVWVGNRVRGLFVRKKTEEVVEVEEIEEKEEKNND